MFAFSSRLWEKEGGREGGRGGGRVEREAREEEEEALIRRLVTIYFEKEETVEKACFFKLQEREERRDERGEGGAWRGARESGKGKGGRALHLFHSMKAQKDRVIA